jgi:carbon storage regulator
MDSKKHGVFMLVLSRKKDESIRIGSDIVITIIEIRGDKVRLGFAAPKDVSIHRQEVYEKIIQFAEEKIAS